ncbi:MAG: aldehyde ferredoxin oxidoreductase C-terminal domain-containing protein [Atribacterota bacterium]|nr:aldehyde ferredoxin oxidoreductase C-terminal domain-containing protein [Atribacterota bacterium]
MTENKLYGYQGKYLRVKLTEKEITEEVYKEDILRNYLGGAGLGTYIMYKELEPSVSWLDQTNRLIFATGPVNGTKFGGSGGYTVVTKGPLTNGAATCVAQGFFGAYLKLSGFDGIIIQGIADEWCYIYIHDGIAEIRPASHLKGKDTWETERIIKKEIETDNFVSILSIGIAGEKLVKFAALIGDQGHSASHNGIGAVMGAKRTKAIVVAKGKRKVSLYDSGKVSKLTKSFFKKVTELDGGLHYKLGTMGSKQKARKRVEKGALPIKNYTTNLVSNPDLISTETLMAQSNLKFKWKPCWACKYHHCYFTEIISGEYTGYKGESLDYEIAAGFGPLLGIDDLAGITVLGNEADRLGLEANESCWMVACLMECFEKGLISKEVTGGKPLNWGDINGTKEILRKIAYREGFGDVLAEGVKRATKQMGKEVQKIAIYTEKGNTPRMQDHRSSWPMMLDTVTSDRGRDQDGALIYDIFTPNEAAKALVQKRGHHAFSDSLEVCKFNLIGLSNQDLAELINAVVGWDFDDYEVTQLGLRITNLLRSFNIRHGHSRILDKPSLRYCSTPKDGPIVGKGIRSVWEETLDKYYELMGWDIKTGKPLPKTLKDLGLDFIIKDIWC